jgi:hypothetical protein
VLEGQSLRGYNEAFLKAHAGELLMKIGKEITKLTQKRIMQISEATRPFYVRKQLRLRSVAENLL